MCPIAALWSSGSLVNLLACQFPRFSFCSLVNSSFQFLLLTPQNTIMKVFVLIPKVQQDVRPRIYPSNRPNRPLSDLCKAIFHYGHLFHRICILLRAFISWHRMCWENSPEGPRLLMDIWTPHELNHYLQVLPL